MTHFVTVFLSDLGISSDTIQIVLQGRQEAEEYKRFAELHSSTNLQRSLLPLEAANLSPEDMPRLPMSAKVAAAGLLLALLLFSATETEGKQRDFGS